MLNIENMTSGGTFVGYLYEEAAPKTPGLGKYYEDERGSQLVLAGKGAELLGLAGPTDSQAVEMLARNRHPVTGERLTQRNKTNRRDGFDISFHPPKEFTLQALLSGDSAAVEATLQAAKKTMSAIEQEAKCRVRAGGQNTDRTTANMLYILCTHLTSRPVNGVSDPHLHVHGFTANATHDPVEDKWKALQLGDIKKNAPYYQALFHTNLREAWEKAGYELVKRGDHFVPAHISEELVHKFSRRTALIEETARRRGITDRERKAELGARTREKKLPPRSFDEQREQWRERLTPEERQLLDAAKEDAARLRAAREHEPAPEPQQPERVATAERATLPNPQEHHEPSHTPAVPPRTATTPTPEPQPQSKSERDVEPQNPDASVPTAAPSPAAPVQRQDGNEVRPKPALELPPSKATSDARRVIEQALEQALERDSVVSEKRLLALAMKKADVPVSLPQLLAALEERPLIRHATEKEVLLTTPEVLQEEKRMLAFAREGRGTCMPLAPDAKTTGIGSLSGEHHEAYRAVLESYDRVTLLQHGAGTGRSTLMKQIIRTIEAHDRRVFTFAPSGEHARQHLKEAGIENADTVARLFADEKLQKSLRGQVLWIDQAGRLGVRGMARVFDIAKQHDARVILSGDDRRHGPVERGGAFRLLARDAGVKTVELKTIERQRGELRQAVAAAADGRTDAAWKRLEQLSSIVELPQEQAHRQLAQQYVKETSRGNKTIAVAPGRGEREKVTTAIREELRTAGKLKGKERRVQQLASLGLTEAERRDSASYKRGQVIRFYRSTRGFQAGDRTTVLGRDLLGNVWVKGKAGPQLLKTKHGDRFDVYEKRSIELARGDTIRITGSGKTAIGNHQLRSGATYRIAGFVPLSGDLILNNGWVVKRNFGHLAHGYCVSSYGVQDKPVDRVLLAQSKESFGTASQEQFYTVLGAARLGVRIFTDDAKGLQQRIAQPKEKLSATDLEEARLAAEFNRHLKNMERPNERARDREL